LISPSIGSTEPGSGGGQDTPIAYVEFEPRLTLIANEAPLESVVSAFDHNTTNWKSLRLATLGCDGE
jgi:hypothetical protein